MTRLAPGILAAWFAVWSAAAMPGQPSGEPSGPTPGLTPVPEPEPTPEPEVDSDTGSQAGPGADPNARRSGFFSGSYNRAARPVWDFEIEANVWYASPGGDVAIGGSPLVSTATLNVDSPRTAPMVEAHSRFDPFSLSLRGSLLDVDGSTVLAGPETVGAVTFAGGDFVSTSYRLDEAAVRVGYRAYQFTADPDRRGLPLLSAGVDVLGGLRVYDGTIAVTGAAGSVGSSFVHIEPLIGFAADVSFLDRYEIQMQNTIGGTPAIDGQSSFTADIQVTFKYRPTENAAVQVGYRIRQNSLEGDDYDIDGAVAGIFAGLTVRF